MEAKAWNTAFRFCSVSPSEKPSNSKHESYALQSQIMQEEIGTGRKFTPRRDAASWTSSVLPVPEGPATRTDAESPDSWKNYSHTKSNTEGRGKRMETRQNFRIKIIKLIFETDSH